MIANKFDQFYNHYQPFFLYQQSKFPPIKQTLHLSRPFSPYQTLNNQQLNIPFSGDLEKTLRLQLLLNVLRLHVHAAPGPRLVGTSMSLRGGKPSHQILQQPSGDCHIVQSNVLAPRQESLEIQSQIRQKINGGTLS